MISKLCPNLSAVISYHKKDGATISEVCQQKHFYEQLSQAKSHFKKAAFKELDKCSQVLPWKPSEQDMVVFLQAKSVEDLETILELVHLLRLKRKSDLSSHPVTFILQRVSPKAGMNDYNVKQEQQLIDEFMLLQSKNKGDHQYNLVYVEGNEEVTEVLIDAADCLVLS